MNKEEWKKREAAEFARLPLDWPELYTDPTYHFGTNLIMMYPWYKANPFPDDK